MLHPTLTQSMTYPTGETIADRYVLQEVIGEGGQAIVCRALDKQTGQYVAVKLLNDRASRSAEVLERVRREQQAMVALAGTHAVGFFDLCRASSGALCLVMELLEGRDLEHRLDELERAGTLMAVDELVQLIAPLVETLEQAHSVGIVHRDLKPGNVFLVAASAGGGTRLLDFGFARLAGSSHVTQAGMVMGSPSYIAPEMWLGHSDKVSARSDVYSLAVVLYRMLSGEFPFGGETLQQKFLHATTTERPSLHARRPDLPDKIDLWVERALAIDPADRFPSVRACWNELMWALDRAPRPVHGSVLETAAPSPDVETVREWLEAPANTLPERLNAAFRMAVSSLRRLRAAVSPSKPESQPPSRPDVVPPPLPGERTASKLTSDPAPRIGRKTIRGPLPPPNLPPVSALPLLPQPTPAPAPRALAQPSKPGPFEVVPPPLPGERALMEAARGSAPQDTETLPRVEPADPAPGPEAADPRTLLRMPADPLRAPLPLAQGQPREPRTLLRAQPVAAGSKALPTDHQAKAEGNVDQQLLFEQQVETQRPVHQHPVNTGVSRVLVTGPESGVSATGETIPLDDYLAPSAAPRTEPEKAGPSDVPARRSDSPLADDDTLVAFDEPPPVLRKTTPLPPARPNEDAGAAIRLTAATGPIPSAPSSEPMLAKVAPKSTLTPVGAISRGNSRGQADRRPSVPPLTAIVEPAGTAPTPKAPKAKKAGKPRAPAKGKKTATARVNATETTHAEDERAKRRATKKKRTKAPATKADRSVDPKASKEKSTRESKGAKPKQAARSKSR